MDRQQGGGHFGSLTVGGRGAESPVHTSGSHAELGQWPCPDGPQVATTTAPLLPSAFSDSSEGTWHPYAQPTWDSDHTQASSGLPRAPQPATLPVWGGAKARPTLPEHPPHPRVDVSIRLWPLDTHGPPNSLEQAQAISTEARPPPPSHVGAADAGACRRVGERASLPASPKPGPGPRVWEPAGRRLVALLRQGRPWVSASHAEKPLRAQA